MPYNYRPVIQMVIIDLDGTLLNNDKLIGKQDYETLIKLGKYEILRVFATGRNLHSCFNALPENCPVDYLVFSSGAGILDWKTKQIIYKSAIPQNSVIEIERILRELNLNFSIHFPVPENHNYYFHKGNDNFTDFDRRNELYAQFGLVLKENYPLEDASQFLIIIENEKQIQTIKDHINGFKIIRATSPIDNTSIWLEIFNENVSKAEGGKFLCNLSGISEKSTLGIGNDYNDIDMLNWVSYSFIVSNAPEAIKKNFIQCSDNQNNPLTDVLNRISFNFA
jgi:Cof subfamily protein (haloacid dehalogenase superfamily)